jgi:hypothetical protein
VANLIEHDEGAGGRSHEEDQQASETEGEHQPGAPGATFPGGTLFPIPVPRLKCWHAKSSFISVVKHMRAKNPVWTGWERPRGKVINKSREVIS